MLFSLYTFIAFITGSFVGSFLNLTADRLQTGETIVKGRSHCDFCKHKLTGLELIPVVSFLVNRGKSKCCKKNLSVYYPLSELLTGAGYAFILHFSGIYENLTIYVLMHVLFLLLIFSVYVVIIFSDLKYRIIPDKVIFFGVVLTIVVILLESFYLNYYFYNQLKSDAFGVYMIKVGYFNDRVMDSLQQILGTLLSTLGVWVFFIFLIIITKGRGMGGGDAKLGILIGLVNGFPNNVLAIFLGFIFGAIYSIVFLLMRKTTLKDTIPFGPFLIMGSMVAYVWGSSIIRWYIGL